MVSFIARGESMQRHAAEEAAMNTGTHAHAEGFGSGRAMSIYFLDAMLDDEQPAKKWRRYRSVAEQTARDISRSCIVASSSSLNAGAL